MESKCPGPTGKLASNGLKLWACDGANCPVGGNFKSCIASLSKRGYVVVLTDAAIVRPDLIRPVDKTNETDNKLNVTPVKCVVEE